LLEIKQEKETTEEKLAIVHKDKFPEGCQESTNAEIKGFW